MAALPGGANSNHGIGNPADDDAAAWGFTPGGREGPTLGGDDRHVAGRTRSRKILGSVSGAEQRGLKRVIDMNFARITGYLDSKPGTTLNGGPRRRPSTEDVIHHAAQRGSQDPHVESRSAKKKKFDEEVRRIWGRRRSNVTLVTGSYDGTTKLWCLTGQAKAHPMMAHNDAVMYADVSQDARYLVTAAYDGVATVWCVRETVPLARLAGSAGGLYSAQFSPDGQHILTASADGVACLWRWQTQEVIWILDGHQESYMRCASFSPDSQRLVTCSADCTVCIWRLQPGEPGTFAPEAPRLVRSLHGHWGWVNTAYFSPDGTFVLSAAADKTAKLWCSHTGECVQTFQGHYAYVRSAVFSFSPRWILTASADWTAKLWSRSNGSCVQTYQGHSQWVNMANFVSSSEEKIVTCSRDCTARLWAIGGECLRVFEGHSDFVMVSLILGRAESARAASVRGRSVTVFTFFKW
ncbi:unnamed protein product [Durusdinium trenchii]|uniref:Uncharacterized protein n=1 Tax=Durusdinium trenchii TaxID=1381693 RepID=A0ABP0NB31_9DINO